MPGNRSRYIVKRSHAETLKLWRIPEWFNIKQYDCAKKWTATRWLIEINFRRKIYTQTGLTWFYLHTKEDWYGVIKSLYNCAPKSVRFETTDVFSGVKIPSKEGIRNISVGIKNMKIAIIKLTETSGILDEEAVFIVDLVRPHDHWLVDLEHYSNSSFCTVVMAAEIYDPNINYVNRSIISVDLDAPNAAIEEAFHVWLEEVKKKKNIHQRTNKMGRPPSSVGPQQFQIWARDRYLAYLDMRELIKREENLPDPDYNEWLSLLDLSTRDFNVEKAEWLLSDDANGFLRAAAQREGYRVE